MAKHSLRSDLGYMLIDHRASPGTPQVPEGTIFEGDLICCSHCTKSITLSKDITNIVSYCSKCDAYICPECAKLGECFPITELIDACGAGKLEELLSKRKNLL